MSDKEQNGGTYPRPDVDEMIFGAEIKPIPSER